METLPTDTMTNTIPETLSAQAVLPAETKPSLWLEKLTSITQLRDGILIVAAFCFVLGYISVIYTAHRNNLGFIPPLQPQCVIAGIVPTLLIGAALLVLRASEWLLERVLIWISEPDTAPERAKRRRPFLVTWWIVISCYVPIILVKIIYPKSVFNLPLVNMIILYAIGFFGSVQGNRSLKDIQDAYNKLIYNEVKNEIDQMLISNPSELDDNPQMRQALLDNSPEICQAILNNNPQLFSEKTQQHLEKLKTKIKRKDFAYSRFQLSIFPLLLLGISLSVWLTVAYPNMPQEFGGMKPRFASLDFKKDDVSDETRALLLPPPAIPLPPSKHPAAVLRSQLLDVYYENSEALFVRQHRASLETPVYQIKKDVIKGVLWGGYTNKSLQQIKQTVSKAKQKI